MSRGRANKLLCLRGESKATAMLPKAAARRGREYLDFFDPELIEGEEKDLVTRDRFLHSA